MATNRKTLFQRQLTNPTSSATTVRSNKANLTWLGEVEQDMDLLVAVRQKDWQRKKKEN